jgi:hypothetical protein
VALLLFFQKPFHLQAQRFLDSIVELTLLVELLALAQRRSLSISSYPGQLV